MSTLSINPAQDWPAADTVTAPVVQTQGLGRVVDDRVILRDIGLTLPRGGFLALLGANGAGKSTLLFCLATLTPATSGRLLLFGREVKKDAARLRARIGMISHQAMLYRDLPALENLTFFGRLYGVARPAQKAAELLEMVKLADWRYEPPKNFSRGMLQRLAIARSLMHDPDLLLADEPFTGLDVRASRQLEDLLRQLHGAGKTIILTHHNIAQSLELAGRVVVLRRGRVALDAPTGSPALAQSVEEILVS